MSGGRELNDGVNQFLEKWFGGGTWHISAERGKKDKLGEGNQMTTTLVWGARTRKFKGRNPRGKVSKNEKEQSKNIGSLNLIKQEKGKAVYNGQ